MSMPVLLALHSLHAVRRPGQRLIAARDVFILLAYQAQVGQVARCRKISSSASNARSMPSSSNHSIRVAGRDRRRARVSAAVMLHG